VDKCKEAKKSRLVRDHRLVGSFVPVLRLTRPECWGMYALKSERLKWRDHCTGDGSKDK